MAKAVTTFHARSIPTYTARSVGSFLNYLLPTQEHWKFAKRGDLAYRGQASGAWGLVPKAFRPDQTIGYQEVATGALLNRVVPQARAEFDAVHQFVKTADSVGLKIPEEGARLLLQEDPRRIFGSPDWHYAWPQPQILETLALAQHHGVPTRLLDFTEDPLIGAYFAADSRWESNGRQSIGRTRNDYLAVWVIDLRFIRAINAIDHRYPERLGEVRVPRGSNSYLHAQFGFFLIDRGANDVMSKGEPLSLDGAIADRAKYWTTGKRLSSRDIIPEWFGEVPIKLVRLGSHRTQELLQELESRGITKASTMPSMDRVVESLELQRTFRA